MRLDDPLDGCQDTRPKLIGTRSFGFIWNVVLDHPQDDASAPRFDAEGPVPVVLLKIRQLLQIAPVGVLQESVRLVLQDGSLLMVGITVELPRERDGTSFFPI